jgi:transposase
LGEGLVPAYGLGSFSVLRNYSSAVLEPHMPATKGFGRPRTHDLREILDAIFCVLKSGCQWRLLPHDFP